MNAVPAWFVYLNAALRFALELTALAVLAVWGFTLDAGWPVRIVAGIGVPLAAALLWGMFVAPKAKRFLPLPGRLAVEAVVFGSAVIALISLGRTTFAVVLGLLAAINSTLVHWYRDDERMRKITQAG